MTHSDVVVVGGGLSGLTAAWQLHRHGFDVRLLEARPRLGGRVLTTNIGDGHYDMGPSWIWPGQPHVAELVKHFKLEVCEQFTEGDLLHQSAEGRLHRDALNQPMAGAYRIRGGSGALVDALQNEFPRERVFLGTAIQSLSLCSEKPAQNTDATAPAVDITVKSESGDTTVVSANRVALAIPLRLAADLEFAPALDESSVSLMRSTPTWMAGHAKFLAVYDSPFWREQGLSGSVLSRRGPLAEIHDASMATGSACALFGFYGIDGGTRNTLTREQLTVMSTQQLVDLFGPKAADPIHTQVVDWSTEPFTAAGTDRRAPDHHPRYGIQIRPQAVWSNVLDFIVSETAEVNGGLIEGAVTRGWEFAAAVIRESESGGNIRPASGDQKPHIASMSWDWIPSPV